MLNYPSKVGGDTALSTLTTCFCDHYQPLPKHWLYNRELVGEYFSRPGKYLRPLLLLATGLMSDTSGHRRDIDQESLEHQLAPLWEVANCMERFHLGACLALDDVIDQATYRRSGKALHVIFEDLARNAGHPSPQSSSAAYTLDIACMTMIELWETLLNAAGLTGGCEKLYQSYCHASAEIGSNRMVTSIVSHIKALLLALRDDVASRSGGAPCATLHICLEAFQETLEGELRDMELARPGFLFPTLQEVFELQWSKTSAYSIWLPMALGVLLTNADVWPVVAQDLKKIAVAFGQAFQIEDDLLLLYPPDVAGKSTQSDLERGSKTSLIVAAYQLLPPVEQPIFASLLESCRDSAEARKEALSCIWSSGAVQLCQNLVASRAAVCQSALFSLEAAGFDTSLLAQIIAKMVRAIDNAPLKVILSGSMASNLSPLRIT